MKSEKLKRGRGICGVDDEAGDFMLLTSALTRRFLYLNFVYNSDSMKIIIK